MRPYFVSQATCLGTATTLIRAVCHLARCGYDTHAEHARFYQVLSRHGACMPTNQKADTNVGVWGAFGAACCLSGCGFFVKAPCFSSGEDLAVLEKVHKQATLCRPPRIKVDTTRYSPTDQACSPRLMHTPLFSLQRL